MVYSEHRNQIYNSKDYTTLGLISGTISDSRQKGEMRDYTVKEMRIK
jgi:hypothetical protein